MSNVFEWQTITLPSKGVLYGDKLPDGQVDVREFTVEEYERLASSKGNINERISRIVSQCSRFPEGFSPSELLLTDRMSLLISQRILTHGAEYEGIPYTCTTCGASDKTFANLAQDLDERTPDRIEHDLREKGGQWSDFVFEEPVKYTLPKSGHVLSLRFLRVDDERLLSERQKRTDARSGNDSASLRYRMALRTRAIDGEEKPILEREDFMRSLSGKDLISLQNFLDFIEPGIDLSLYPECNACGAVSQVTLPLTDEFFRPSGF